MKNWDDETSQMLAFLLLPLCAQTQRVRHRHRQKRKKKNIPPHISAFSSHLTANALWVMLELEHGTENLWMSLYTYMDDEDAF